MHVLIHSDQRTNNVRYKYTLIASEDMDGYPLHRLELPRQPGKSQETMNFSHPYSGFPSLESHVHPCFAICHAGRFSKQVDGFVEHIHPDISSRLTSMTTTYSNWLAATPDMAFRQQPRVPPDEDDPSEGDRTRMRRLDKPSPRRSLRLQSKENRQVSPSEGRGSKKRQRSDEQHDCQDNRSLRDLEAEKSRPHTYKHKREFVQDWVSSVIGQTFVEDDSVLLRKCLTYDVSGAIDDDPFPCSSELCILALQDKGVDTFKRFHHTPHDISVS
jgi:hypothetical protein